MARVILEREDIIPLLAEIFRKHGYEGASIGRIVAKTGLGRSSLYHAFPAGKQDMAGAVLDNIAAWFEENVFTPLDTRPPKEALPRMFEAVSAYFHSGQRICLVGAFALDATRDMFASQVSEYFRRWLTALAGCLERGGCPPRQAMETARQTVAAIQGAIVLARATGEADAFETSLARLRADLARLPSGLSSRAAD